MRRQCGDKLNYVEQRALHLSELDEDQDSCEVTPKFAKNSKYCEMERAATEPIIDGAKLLKPVQQGSSQTMSDCSKVSKHLSASEVINSSVAFSTHSSAGDSNLLSTHCSFSCHNVSPVSTTTSPLSCTTSLLFTQTELHDSSNTPPVMQLGIAPVIDSLSQNVFSHGAIAPFNQQVEEESSEIHTGLSSFLDQSPNLSYSSANSSPACFHVSSISQQDFNPDSSCCGSLFVDPDHSPLCSMFSPEVVKTPIASVSSTTSVSVPNSQTSCFVSCSSPVNFNSSSFNFSSASFLPNNQTFNFSASLDGCTISETMLHSGSVDPYDSIMSQMFGEADNHSNIGVDLSLPVSDRCIFTDSILPLSDPRGNVAQNSTLSELASSASAQLSAKLASRLLFQSQTIHSGASNNSSPEIKNIKFLQQFI